MIHSIVLLSSTTVPGTPQGEPSYDELDETENTMKPMDLDNTIVHFPAPGLPTLVPIQLPPMEPAIQEQQANAMDTDSDEDVPDFSSEEDSFIAMLDQDNREDRLRDMPDFVQRDDISSSSSEDLDNLDNDFDT